MKGLILLLTLLVICDTNNAVSKRETQKFRTMSSTKLRKAASLSDMDYFWDVLLRPFLRERVPDTKGNLIAQQHIKASMGSLGWHIDEDPFEASTPYGTKRFNNIIATLDPQAPEKLVLACHFDSKYFANFRFIGATDSAVPCAMMIDLARLLNDSLFKLKSKVQDLTLQLIFFDGEEAFGRWTDKDSIYGAKHLAERLSNEKIQIGREGPRKAKIDTITAMVLLDLIGTKDPTFKNWFSQTSPMFERLQNIEKRLAKEQLLSPARDFDFKSNKYFVGQLKGYGGIEDDHKPFLERNVPILHLIAHPFPSVWHQSSDDESALHRETIDNLNKILRVFVLEYFHMSP